MSRQASSGRLPAYGALTQAHRDDIARSHTNERPNIIALRLGIPKRLVKAEIRRLRAESVPPAEILGRRRSVAAALKIVAPVIFGAAFLGLAIKHRIARTALVLSQPSGANATAVAALYRDLDRGKSAVETTLTALEDPDEELCLAAIRAYMTQPPPSRDPEPLVQRLNDGPERLRLAAIQGIGMLGDSRAVSALSAVVASPRSAAERGLALDSLGKIAADSAIPPMISALKDPLSSIRVRAFSLLVKRLGTSLSCSKEQVEKAPGPVHGVFAKYWKEQSG